MKKRTLIGVVAGALLLAGCSGISTAPDQNGLHYNDGPLSSKSFNACVPASTRDWGGVGDQYIAYPNNQREWKFGSPVDQNGNPQLNKVLKDYDRPSETFVTKNSVVKAEDGSLTTAPGIQMSVAGRVAFRLNTDCQVLRKFHELIGSRYKAYMDGDDITPGWIEMLGTYVGGPVSTAIDRAGQEFEYTDLYNNPSAKAAWEQRVTELLPELVNRQSDGTEEFFRDFTVTLQKPEPPNEIRALLLDTQKRVANAQAQQADAAAQVAVADAQAKQARAQVAIAKANAEAKAAEIAAAGGPDNYVKLQAIEKGITPWPATVVVGTGGTVQPK